MEKKRKGKRIEQTTNRGSVRTENYRKDEEAITLTEESTKQMNLVIKKPEASCRLSSVTCSIAFGITVLSHAVHGLLTNFQGLIKTSMKKTATIFCSYVPRNQNFSTMRECFGFLALQVQLWIVFHLLDATELISETQSWALCIAALTTLQPEFSSFNQALPRVRC